ncbi:unnamed protein product [Protopolystoma xenopodis]|uniref:Ig-like domain-containing protein n=1 Tax=Protopolystoma xenopodis TaxID=117903 RepID=A0A448WS05_9PLAT|nr:unnamed protein product [Protopolystoma xenopodis]
MIAYIIASRDGLAVDVFEACYPLTCLDLIGLQVNDFITTETGLIRTSTSAIRLQKYLQPPQHIRISAKEGQRVVIRCPVIGSVHSGISWYRLPRDGKQLLNLTKLALSSTSLQTFLLPSGLLAEHMEQMNLSWMYSQYRVSVLVALLGLLVPL